MLFARGRAPVHPAPRPRLGIGLPREESGERFAAERRLLAGRQRLQLPVEAHGAAWRRLRAPHRHTSRPGPGRYSPPTDNRRVLSAASPLTEEPECLPARDEARIPFGAIALLTFRCGVVPVDARSFNRRSLYAAHPFLFVRLIPGSRLPPRVQTPDKVVQPSARYRPALGRILDVCESPQASRVCEPNGFGPGQNSVQWCLPNGR